MGHATGRLQSRRCAAAPRVIELLVPVALTHRGKRNYHGKQREA